MTTSENKTLERFIELYEADREKEAWELAGDLYLENWPEYCRILKWYCDVEPPSTWPPEEFE